MAAYKEVVDSIKARLKEARATLKGMSAGPMRKDYEAEIKRLENRLRVAKTKVPKRNANQTTMSAPERARQGLPPVSVDKKPKTKVKNEKTLPPKTESKDNGASTGLAVKTPFGGKKFGGLKFGGKRFGASSDPYKSEAEREAAKKDAQILKNIRAAEKEAEKESKESKEAKSKVPAGISEIKDDRSGRKYKAKRKKERETKQADDITAAQKVRGAVDKMSAAERKSLGPVTNFMEKLLGLNRDKATIERDMKVTEDLEKELGFSGGKKRGGRVKKRSVSHKKYAMNRGGKVASIRKPTRA